MKVFISADMEGITGVYSGAATEREHADYPICRRLMTQDVNAAVQGAVDAGADEVWVNDSHGGANNILIEELHPKAHLIQGWNEVSRMTDGIDETFAAALLVGYHARSLTEDGCISHTMIGACRRLRYNDIEIGEYGISAAHAGAFGVPVVFVSGDEVFCEQAADLLGDNLCRAAVKRFFTRQSGVCLPLEQAHELIREQAREGVRRRDQIAPWNPLAPIEVKLEFHRQIDARAAALVPTVERVDSLTVSAEVKDGLAAASLVEVFLRMAG